MAGTGYLDFYFDAHVTPDHIHENYSHSLTYSQRIDFFIEHNMITIDSGYVAKKFYSDSSYQNEVSPDTMWDPNTDVTVYVKIGPEHDVNKVVFGTETLIDLTNDTVQANKLLSGYTAHDKSGATITGTCTFDANTQDANATGDDILLNKTGYVRGNKITGTMPNIGKQTAVIDTKTQTVSISQGYHDGSGTVAINSTEQAKLIAENIREGVVILGVTGTMAGQESVIAQAKTVTPTTSQQTVLPDTGYTHLSQVTVNAIPRVDVLNSAGGLTVTIG